jgi:MFS transporter, putative metabolite:H+ symporter
VSGGEPAEPSDGEAGASEASAPVHRPGTVGLVSAAVLLAALGNMVDTYDLVLFSVVRVASLRDLGVTGPAGLEQGLLILNLQMLGMLIGGVAWGVLGDRRGRLSVLFGSILVYSLANLANAFVQSVPSYAVCRLIAGIGLAGELGAGITLVSEILPRDRRGYGTMIVAAVGLLGAVTAVLVSRVVAWRTCYLIGGGAGLMLLALRVSVRESGLFARSRLRDRGHGSLWLLLGDRRRRSIYLCCVLIGLPIWYVIGILITLAPEFGKALQVDGALVAGTGVMLSYGGGAFGDLLSGLLSQRWRSRRRVLILFIGCYAACALSYHLLRGAPAWWFSIVFLLLGVSSGFWVTLITLAAEQFGTNVRATVATSVPNMVRALIIPISAGFALLRPHLGFVNASLAIGGVCFAISLWCATRLQETFGKDLDYAEEP